MKNKYIFKNCLQRLFFLTLVSCSIIACSDDDNAVDQTNERTSLVLTPTAYQIELNEDTPNEVALALNWTEADPIGPDFYVSYLYKMDLANNNFGTNTMVREYIDDSFSKTYTHKELQNLLVTKWKQQPGDLVTLQARIIGSLEGPKFVKPEIATISIKVKMYSEKAFMADYLYMSGTAIDGEDVEIKPMESRPKRYMAICNLKAGNINFPMVWKDENKLNAITPSIAEQPITSEAMEAKVKSVDNAGHWIIPEDGTYRVVVDFDMRTVSIGLANNYVEADKIYISGSCVTTNQEMTRTIENENQYAFHGELKAGNIYFPILFEGECSTAISPNESGDFTDGVAMNVTTHMTETAALGYHWNIKTAGVYRVVINTETKKITIYSPSTDLKPKNVSWDFGGAQKSDIETIYIWGPYNGWLKDGIGDTGYSKAYSMKASLANPCLFVYKSETDLPRQSKTDNYIDGAAHSGALNFKIDARSAGCFAFGSDGKAERGKKNDVIDITSSQLGQKFKVIEGQGNNRYNFFAIPAGTNYIELDVKNLTVLFDTKK